MVDQVSGIYQGGVHEIIEGEDAAGSYVVGSLGFAIWKILALMYQTGIGNK